VNPIDCSCAASGRRELDVTGTGIRILYGTSPRCGLLAKSVEGRLGGTRAVIGPARPDGDSNDYVGMLNSDPINLLLD